MAENNNK